MMIGEQLLRFILIVLYLTVFLLGLLIGKGAEITKTKEMKKNGKNTKRTA